MKFLFNAGVLLALGFVALCGYWYAYPHRAPAFFRGEGPTLEFPKPNSPMNNFRPPSW